ncbi:STY4851/ECs_5259 family protein [Sorangium sp. So ce426]|uniref:STY4851/ECs_5259 family protein n=1 Tax=Sorangium sp. So ce426 TaxID=3133312 RepID=UPI003F5B2CD9
MDRRPPAATKTAAAALRRAIAARSAVALDSHRPLYTYRCCDEDFTALEQLLRECAPVRTLGDEEAACFCLYVAEWWRRRYTGGPWAWEPILRDAGHGGKPHAWREDVIHRGLRQWQRPLLRVGDRTGYIVTLACEGGLPLSLIQRQGAHLRRYFRALLRDARIFRDTPLRELAERNAYHLPASYRQPSVYELAAQLVMGVEKLQALAVGAADPVAHLDAHHPDWHNHIPLNAGKALAAALVRGLMDDIAAVEKEPQPIIAAETMLTASNAGLTITRTLRMPRIVRTHDVAVALERSWDTLPRTFELCLEEADGVLTPVALVSRASEGELGAMHVEPLVGTFERTGSAARDVFRIVAVRRRDILAAAEVEGGAALGEVPWVFVRAGDDHGQEGRWRLAGTGAVALRTDAAVLVLPPDAHARPDPGGGLSSRGRVHDIGWEAYEIHGRVKIDIGDGTRCVVSLAQSRDDAPEYHTRGSRLGHLLSPGDVWRGLPRLMERQATDQPVRPISPAHLEWRPRGVGASWRRMDERCLGDVEVRYAPDGEQRFRARWTVLPATADIRLIPGTNGHGELVLHGFGDCRVGAVPPSAAQQRDGNGELKLRFESSGPAPTSVRLHIDFGGNRSTAVNVPYPRREARFLARSGQGLPDEATIWVEQLVGVRAQVLDAQAGGRFYVEGVLQARDADPTKPLTVKEELLEVGPGRHELDLRALAGSIRALLSASQELDAKAKLTLQAHGGRQLAQLRLLVAHYDGALNRSAEELWLEPRSLARLGTTVESLRLEARPLEDPVAPAVQVPRIEAGRWRFVPPPDARGPWLITGWEGRLSRLRPLRVTLGNRLPVAARTPRSARTLSLREITYLSERSARLVAFRELIDQLARDPDASDWSALDALLDTLGVLPAATFEVMPRITEAPEAVALALLRCPSAVALESRWRGLETLPFPVSLVPVRVWIRATRRFQRSYHRACSGKDLDPMDMFAQTLRPFVDKAPVLAPVLGVVVDAMTLTFQGIPAPRDRPLWLASNPGGQRVIRERLEQCRQALLQEHAGGDSRPDPVWPTGNLPYAAASSALTRLRLWPETDGIAERKDVLSAPALAACATVDDTICFSSHQQFELIRLRWFDPTWFDEAHALIASILLADTLSRNSGYLDDPYA